MSGPYYADESVTLLHGNALEVLRGVATGSVACCVTSPPYFGLRDYGVPAVDWPAVDLTPMTGMLPVGVPAMCVPLGLEPDPWAYTAHLVLIFREVQRVLAKDGTLWLNIGDSYAGKANGGEAYDRHRGYGHRSKQGIIPRRQNSTAAARYKGMLDIPGRLGFALQADGWLQRNRVIWNKSNAMPESVTDRLSSRYEEVLLFSRGPRYWFNLDAIREPHADVSIARAAPHRAQPGKRYRDGSASGGLRPGQTLRLDQMNHPGGRNPGDVWTIPTQPFAEAHFAVMASALAERCIQAGCKPGGAVLDPFSGSGTTGLAAARHGRRYVGIDHNSEYLDMSLRTRLAQAGLPFTDTAS